jgi:catechol 2,3-dioxygenase-like lactoylglutathione lyase family enzyme
MASKAQELPGGSLRHIVPILPVRSMQRSLAFFRALGFTAERYMDGDDYAFLDRDGLQMHLRNAPDLIDGQNPAGVYFYLASGTAATLQAEFEAAGITILSRLEVRAWKMNEFMLSDPDGTLLRFGERAGQQP